ncbi:MAG: aldehyde dehydrogenase family protein, partial [Actinomycetota bacterium]
MSITIPSVTSTTTLDRQRSYIGGRYVDAVEPELFDTINPATNTVICQVEQAGQAELDAAVAAATEGFA